MISYWEKIAFTKYDLIVIGGGITGLFSALSFNKKNPDAKIAILERDIFPNGASTKNAGFACFGSISELIEDNKKISDAALFKLVEKRIKGLELLKKTISSKKLNLINNGGYELFFPNDLDPEEYIEKYNDLLFPIYNKKIFSLKNKRIHSLGFSKEFVKKLIFNPFESQINTGTTIFELQKLASKKGIKIITGANVEKFDLNSAGHEIHVLNNNLNISFKSKYLAVCSNAFSKKWFPKLDINPGRGMVLITKPIQNLKIKGCFHYNKGYYYFRNFQNRILFGGGRQLDLKNENTTTFGINKLIKRSLINDLESIIIPSVNYEIDMEWSGIMAFGETKNPIIEKIHKNVVIGVRLGGMGVALGSMVGKEVSDLLLEDS
jgi:glycine/D-amino acid oxidase-like deaminating enzyme|tara:strand:+ start:4497 stop:5630 length:1134 start_codon:yes stop_codon:yes gene_type:complete